MEYFSTRNDKISLKFEHIFIKGLSEDGGLFLPKKIEKFSEKEFSNLKARISLHLCHKEDESIGSLVVLKNFF